MNKDDSYIAKNPCPNENNEVTITNKRVNELSQLQAEHEYWQNKVLEKNQQLLNETLKYSKNKDEVRNKLDHSIQENSKLINKINQLEASVINDKKIIEKKQTTLSEINSNIPLLEKHNIDIYNEVKSAYNCSILINQSILNL